MSKSSEFNYGWVVVGATDVADSVGESSGAVTDGVELTAPPGGTVTVTTSFPPELQPATSNISAPTRASRTRTITPFQRND